MVCTNSRTYLLQKKYNSHQWGGSNMWLHNWDEKRQNAILARNFDGRSVIFDLLLNACCRLLLKLLNRTKLWILLSFWVLWWARTHMFHHATSPLNSQMQKQMCLLQMLFLHHSTSIVFQGSGLQESVLVSMICRAVVLEFFALAIFSGEMQRLWGLELWWDPVWCILFYGLLLIPYAVCWLKALCWVYLDALWHAMLVATGGH